jgi:hypothetical protein
LRKFKNFHSKSKFHLSPSIFSFQNSKFCFLSLLSFLAHQMLAAHSYSFQISQLSSAHLALWPSQAQPG